MILDSIFWLGFWCWVVRKIYLRIFPRPYVKPQGRWVFVTGCDTGFGNMLAKQLDKAGYSVFAGCLTEAGCKDLSSQCSERVVTIRLDITREADIAAAIKVVQSNTDRVHALVNNAGIALGSIVDWTPLSAYRQVMEVNCFGGIAMTKALLPFLIKKQADGTRGRLVNITSLAGIIAADGLSAYCCSKYAFEAFSDSFRREMKGWGLNVSIIEPGFMKTPIVMGAREKLTKAWSEVPQDVKQRWGEDFFQEVIKTVGDIDSITEDPQKTVDVLLDAVGSTAPQVRYRPGRQGYIVGPLSQLPGEISDWITGLRRRNRAFTPLYLRQEKEQEEKKA